jgi:hypothetical protein
MRIAKVLDYHNSTIDMSEEVFKVNWLCINVPVAALYFKKVLKRILSLLYWRDLDTIQPGQWYSTLNRLGYYNIWEEV